MSNKFDWNCLKNNKNYQKRIKNSVEYLNEKTWELKIAKEFLKKLYAADENLKIEIVEKLPLRVTVFEN